MLGPVNRGLLFARKQATHWTRLSCHRFRANEVRLQLSVLAYNLGNLVSMQITKVPQTNSVNAPRASSTIVPRLN